MIVEMAKVHVVSRSRDRERLLEAIASLGMVHLKPVDPERATADEDTLAQIGNLERALQVILQTSPTGQPPKVTVVDAAGEVLAIQRHAVENRNRLASIHRQVEQIRLWGDVELTQFEQLSGAGLNIRFYSVPSTEIAGVQAECVERIAPLPGKRELVATVNRQGEPTVPESAEIIELPQRDAPSLRADAAEIDAAIKKDTQRLSELANLAGKMETTLADLRERAKFTVAQRGGLDDAGLFAVMGWIPAGKAEGLAPGLLKAGIEAGVEVRQPEEDDEPPTLVQTPVWARPIEGLFDILGTVAGYKEFDVSVPFMVTLPIFAAMLISDGGYGAVLLFGPLLAYPKISKALGEQFTRLIMIIGAVAVVWGFLCNSFFGCALPFYDAPLPVNMSESSRSLIMKISFFMGAIHLSVAQLWQAIRIFPNLKFLNKIGWGLFVWGMLGVVGMFVLGTSCGQETPYPYLLIAGALLAILFASPSKNIVKMIGLGLADFPLSMLSAFSDVISYVRLMAVGLASGVLAANFNELALGTGFLPVTILILVFGHGLNLGLAMIALFAHGVRLNMLEFSNNLGMQWTGYPYNPFVKKAIREN